MNRPIDRYMYMCILRQIDRQIGDGRGEHVDTRKDRQKQSIFEYTLDRIIYIEYMRARDIPLQQNFSIKCKTKKRNLILQILGHIAFFFCKQHFHIMQGRTEEKVVRGGARRRRVGGPYGENISFLVKSLTKI